MRLPIRIRLTIITAALVAGVLAAAGAFLYFRLRADLLNAMDANLRSRAETLLGRVEPTRTLPAGGGITDPEDAFAQLLGADGRVIDSTSSLLQEPLLSVTEIAAVQSQGTRQTVDITVEETLPARILAVPAGDGRVLLVGASLEEQYETLSRLTILLAGGSPLVLALVTGVGWLVTGAALRPIEAMRQEAATISASQPGRRLAVPKTGDEVARLAETLNDMLQRLEQALERERRFVGDASHELRTPLANLKAELELALRRPRATEELEQTLRSAAEETDRLTCLAEDLLVLARANGGTIRLAREPVDVANLVAHSVQEFAARAASQEVALESRTAGGVVANLDPARVRQALTNMLDNALRHTPADGAITVTVTRADNALVIEVRDTGTGFPDDFLPRAFEPLSRADAARSRVDGGTGLGLAVVRAVAAAHGGVATVANPPEGGAAVVVRIPL